MAWNYKDEEVFIPQPSSTFSRKTIAILLPHRDNWPAEFTETTWGPLKYQRTDWCDKIYFLARVPSLPLARNNLVNEFLKSGDTLLNSFSAHADPADCGVHFTYHRHGIVSHNHDRNIPALCGRYY